MNGESLFKISNEQLLSDQGASMKMERIDTDEQRGYRQSSPRGFAKLMGAEMAVIRVAALNTVKASRGSGSTVQARREMPLFQSIVQRIRVRALGEAAGGGAIAATWRALAKRS